MKLTSMAVAAMIASLTSSAFAVINVTQQQLENDSAVTSAGNINVSVGGGSASRLQHATMSGANVTFTLADGVTVPAVFHNPTEADWFMQFLLQADQSYSMTITKGSPLSGLSGGNGSGGSGLAGGLAGLGGLLHGGSGGSGGAGGGIGAIADTPLGNVLGGLRAGGANSVNFFQASAPNSISIQIAVKPTNPQTPSVTSCAGGYVEGDVIVDGHGNNPNPIVQVNLAPANVTLDAFTDLIRSALADQGYYFGVEGQTDEKTDRCN